MKTGKGPHQLASHSPQVQKVYFNAELFELWVNGVMIKRLDVRATNQILILTVFQEENWPPRIDDPLHPNGTYQKARLHAAIRCLNGCQHPSLIRFFGDGTGHGIRWEFVSARKHARSNRA